MAKTTMSKKDRNEAILRSLVKGSTREDVAAEFGVSLKKVEKIVVKESDEAQRRADEVRAALGIPATPTAPVKAQVTRKAVPKNVRRLNPEVTERMKVQLITEARTVRDLTDRLDAARKRRNDTIRALCDRGLSEREIGEMSGMSGPRVNQIYYGTNGSRS